MVGSLDLWGLGRPDNAWDATAKGPTYDGRDIFRSFFDLNCSQEGLGKARPGLDLRAEIDTVIGFYDASTRNWRFNTASGSADKLVALYTGGSLEGGKVFAAQLKPRAPACGINDVGQLFKPGGARPPKTPVGGQMRLEVNLDGKVIAIGGARSGRTISICWAIPSSASCSRPRTEVRAIWAPDV